MGMSRRECAVCFALCIAAVLALPCLVAAAPPAAAATAPNAAAITPAATPAAPPAAAATAAPDALPAAAATAAPDALPATTATPAAPPAAAAAPAAPPATAATPAPAPALATAPAPTTTTLAATSTAQAQQDLSTWTARDLAAQLLVVGVYAPTTGKLSKLTKQGIGGVVLLGPIPKKLNSQLKRAGKKAKGGIQPLVASDEEGGQVQRFRKRIYPLPAAQTMGSWSKTRITKATHAYARRLKRYGVTVVLGPVADLKVARKYLTKQQRCFAASPRVVAAKAQAWSAGMQKAGLLTCYKHWPGMGTAGNTHKKVTRVRSFAALQKKDITPFQAAFKRRCDLVMVAHVTVAGLTEKNTPASLSPKAYAALRKQAGRRTVIITDSLSMGATTKSQGISTTTACIRALTAGADLALVASAKDSKALITAVAAAIEDGRIPRTQAEASAQRILALKVRIAGM